MRHILSTLIPLALLLTLTVSACDSNGAVDGADTARVTLNAAASAPIAPKTAASKASSDHVAITEVKLLLKSIAFHTEDEVVEGEGEEPPAEDADDTFRLDPVVVTLVPGGDPVQVEVGELPLETYDRVSFHIHKPRGNETPLDPDFAGDTPSERYSIVVYGIPADDPGADPQILYRSTQNVVQVVDFESAFVPGEGDPSAVTLETLLWDWFVDTDGTELDPSDTSNQNRSRIDRSIRNSFRLFQDDDADGVADDDQNG